MVTTGILNNEEIAQVAINNGFPASNLQSLIICVAIARAESNGNKSAVNTANSNGTTDKGLWQINTVHDSKMPGADRFDPDVNAKLMMMISSNGTNWQPWSTYNNGAYEKYTGEVAADLTGKTFTPGTTPAGTNTSTALGSSAITGVVKFFELLMDLRTWIRVGEGILGFTMIAFGLLMLLKDSSKVKQTVRAGLTVATRGKAAPVIAAAEAAS